VKRAVCAGNIRDATAQFNADLVKQAFAHVMADAQKSMEYFYARLFVQSRQLRALFPLAMDGLRGRVFHALADLIWSIDSPSSAARCGRPAGIQLLRCSPKKAKMRCHASAASDLW
jgi:hypothetical protein